MKKFTMLVLTSIGIQSFLVSVAVKPASPEEHKARQPKMEMCKKCKGMMGKMGKNMKMCAHCKEMMATMQQKHVKHHPNK